MAIYQLSYNYERALASEVYLVQNWQKHVGTSTERRNKIFQEFVKLGMRKRWQLHSMAEKFVFNDDEKEILSCRGQTERIIARRIGEDLSRVMVRKPAHSILEADLAHCTDWKGDDMLMFEYDGSPFDVLPELVYSMTAFDDPDDMEEARKEHDQRWWVSGIYWAMDKVVWVDEYGDTIRERICDIDGLREAVQAFDEFRPFESTWWTEAAPIGKYARDEWWL